MLTYRSRAILVLATASAIACGSSGSRSESDTNKASPESGAGGASSESDTRARSGSSAASDPASELPPDSTTGPFSEPPAREEVLPPEHATGHPICVISADCPPGQHCDLGECVQLCNVDAPCSDGLVCSSRGRCLQPQSSDQDPPMATEHAGSVSVVPLETRLSGREQRLTLTLHSTSSKPVRYRVQVNAPFLSIAEPRGEFTETRDIELDVDASAYRGRDVPGSVRVFTTLGTVVAATPLNAVLTGKYQGSLRYNAGPVDLGDARLALDLVEESGDVRVRIDPEASVLFPEGPEGPTFGFGTYVPGTLLEFVIEQRVDPTLGGERNHFRRPLGRRVFLSLEPSEPGVWEGTFEEQVYGLFVGPSTLSGAVRLEYLPKEVDADFDDNIIVPTVAMPPDPDATAFVTPDAVFGRPGPAREAGESYGTVLQKWYSPLLTSLRGRVASGEMTFETLRQHCESALGLTAADPGDTSHPCGDAVALAAAHLELAQANVPWRSADARLFGTLMQALASPSALVAQDHMAAAVRMALISGNVATEVSEYDAAVAALSPVVGWFLQPGMLEYLRGVADDAAALPPDLSALALPADSPDTLQDPYPAARALAQLLRLLSEAEAERTRQLALTQAPASSDPAADAQAEAVLTYLEAAALLGVLAQWPGVSPAVSANLSGVLEPLDTSFAALVQGADALGIADRVVPFVYRDGDIASGSTNYEQVASQAKASAEQAAAEEQRVEQQARDFSVEQHELESQRTTLVQQYDSQLRALCGADFEPDRIEDADDWESCGTRGGQVGSLAAELEQAQARWRSEENRIRGMKDKIEIAETTLATTQNIHRETLTFITENGESLSAVTMAIGTLDAVSSAMQMASGGFMSLNPFSALIGGAFGAAEFVIKMNRAQLEVQRQELQTAQTMRFEQASMDLELAQGMADIQRQAIDLVQLGVDIQLNVLDVLQSRVEATNAVEEAKRLFGDRARALALAGKNPIGDPSFRVIRDEHAQAALGARQTAQRDLMLAARALRYEINMPLPGLAGAVLAARTGVEMQRLLACMDSVFDGYNLAYGAPQDYTHTVSVRELLGITGPRTDEVTGEELSPGQQFRMLVLRNENLTEDDSVRVTFSTNLNPGNGLWSLDVCNDRIKSVQAQLVGDFLGDNEAEIHVTLSGTAVQRACDSDEIRVWSLQPRDAVIQAGVNGFGEAPPNKSFYGQSVARTTWEILIKSGKVAAANADLDFTRLDDVVLKITHGGSAVQSSTEVVKSLTCAAGFDAN